MQFNEDLSTFVFRNILNILWHQVLDQVCHYLFSAHLRSRSHCVSALARDDTERFGEGCGTVKMLL